MTKYMLSQDELGHLYQELVQEGLLERVDGGYVAPPKKQIVIEEFVDDIRSGTSDSKLMDRYELTAPLLTATLRQLLEQKSLDQEDLDSRDPSPLSRVSLFSLRQVPRYSSPLTV